MSADDGKTEEQLEKSAKQAKETVKPKDDSGLKKIIAKTEKNTDRNN